MARGLELDELVEHFTLLPDEVALLGDKSGASRLGFALLLRHFTLAGRFPTGRRELADEAVEFVWSSSHARAELNSHLGTRHPLGPQ